ATSLARGQPAQEARDGFFAVEYPECKIRWHSGLQCQRSRAEIAFPAGYQGEFRSLPFSAVGSVGLADKPHGLRSEGTGNSAGSDECRGRKASRVLDDELELQRIHHLTDDQSALEH